MKRYQQFLQLIHPQPGFKVLDITSHADMLTAAILEHLSPFPEHRLALSLYPGEHHIFESGDSLKMHSVPNYSTPFRALPRDNDVVLIRDVLQQHAFRERMLKGIYTTLANTGDIIIISKKGSADIEEQKAMLEAAEFRASNSIDILEGYDLVMAKKMHMWGNGL
jgi:hypothetical protein